MTHRRGRRPQQLMVWIGGFAVILAVASVIAVGAFFVVKYNASAPESQIATPLVPTLLRDASLRSGPSPTESELARLVAGTSLDLIGRSPDGQWLVISPTGERELIGWVPVVAVGGPIDVSTLGVIATAATAVPIPGVQPLAPTFTPDLPDLVVESIASRDNRLVVVVANIGAGDVGTTVLLTVNEGAPQPLGARPGEPIRAGERVEYALPEEYIQRRAVARVTASTDPPVVEETLANNTLETIVSPDLPNDLEILDAANVPPDQHLRVKIRNDSPIPVVGPVTVTVRTIDGASTLLGRQDARLDLAAGAIATLDFPATVGVDFTKAQILLVTESINDAVSLNNVFPR